MRSNWDVEDPLKSMPKAKEQNAAPSFPAFVSSRKPSKLKFKGQEQEAPVNSATENDLVDPSSLSEEAAKPKPQREDWMTTPRVLVPDAQQAEEAVCFKLSFV